MSWTLVTTVARCRSPTDASMAAMRQHYPVTEQLADSAGASSPTVAGGRMLAATMAGTSMSARRRQRRGVVVQGHIGPSRRSSTRPSSLRPGPTEPGPDRPGGWSRPAAPDGRRPARGLAPGSAGCGGGPVRAADLVPEPGRPAVPQQGLIQDGLLDVAA